MTQDHGQTILAANQALFVDGDLDAVERHFDPTYHVHLTDRDLAGGHDLVRKGVGMVRRAFPELAVEVEVLVEAGDRVAWQRTLRCVQRGPYAGFPASDREVVWRDMVTSVFRDGRIAEEWIVSDLAEQLLTSRKR